MAEIVTMPKLGFDMAEGVLIRWAVQIGEPVEKGALLAEIETDKATVEVEAPYSGTVLQHLVEEDSIVPVNDPIAVIGEPGETVDIEAATPAADTNGSAPAAEAETAQPEAPAAPMVGLPDGIKASPVARRMATDLGIDLATVQGSGPGGRIVKKDIEAYRAPPKPGPAPAGQLPSPPAALAAAEGDTTIKLTRLRQAIGRRMVESRQWYPHFYVTNEFDIDKLMVVRKQANAALADQGIKLSVNDFVIKGVALALREFPNLNASLGQGELILHQERNIGIAVAVEGGLLTIVCRQADTKPLSQISTEVRAMAERARSGKVHPDDIQGSTFTTSNLGMFDVEQFVAIINPPEAGILAISAGKKKPVVLPDGSLGVGWRMKCTISADHRVTDGAEAAQFMQALAGYLEEPLKMMV
jgi:pyruvate dehydrogenase E2 component (dihydrolipoamide acetyltransferase)